MLLVSCVINHLEGAPRHPSYFLNSSSSLHSSGPPVPSPWDSLSLVPSGELFSGKHISGLTTLPHPVLTGLPCEVCLRDSRPPPRDARPPSPSLYPLARLSVERPDRTLQILLATGTHVILRPRLAPNRKRPTDSEGRSRSRHDGRRVPISWTHEGSGGRRGRGNSPHNDPVGVGRTESTPLGRHGRVGAGRVAGTS